MKKLLNKMMLSCRKATELIIKQEYIELSAGKKVQLFFHTLICSSCRRFASQNHLINEALERHILSSSVSINEEDAPRNLKDHILEKLPKTK